MKVISGIYKGRKIIGHDIDGTRPTMDRVKESLFAIIQDYLNDSIILDLFSGSGNLGIEAISQGAKYAYLVDSNPKASRTIKTNANNLGISNCDVINMDYKKALKYLSDQQKQFDLIFLDPPYQTNYIEKSITLIYELKLLSPTGLIICESDKLDKIVYSERYIIVKEKKYGDKWVVILKQI